MDMNKASKTYPRWIGVALALLLPGSAHFLSGRKAAGALWLATLFSIPMAGHTIIAIPLKATIIAGLVLNFAVLPLLYIAMLINSYRRVQRLRIAGWAGYILALFTINIVLNLYRGFLPATPYKVPTGAMQPTLRGIVATNEKNATGIFSWAFTGRKHQEFRATGSGETGRLKMSRTKLEFSIGGVAHELPAYVLDTFWPKKEYAEGDVIWSGTKYEGDCIMVERLSYLLHQPRRGDIVVFSTDSIENERVRKGAVYIKRIVGLPGETVRINPPDLVINGRILRKPVVFQTLDYANAGQLATPEQSITLGEAEYLVLGDNANTGGSLDGRFFGPIQLGSIIGRASTIYWPLQRIGPIE